MLYFSPPEEGINRKCSLHRRKNKLCLNFSPRFLTLAVFPTNPLSSIPLPYPCGPKRKNVLTETGIKSPEKDSDFNKTGF